MLPVLWFVYIHTRVVPSKLLTRFYTLILSCKLSRTFSFQIFYVISKIANGDRWMGEHTRSLKIHSSHLNRIGRSNHACILHFKPRHKRCHDLTGVHWLFDGMPSSFKENDHNDYCCESYSSYDWTNYPDEVSSPRVRQDIAAVGHVVTRDRVLCRGPSSRGYIRF